MSEQSAVPKMPDFNPSKEEVSEGGNRIFFQKARLYAVNARRFVNVSSGGDWKNATFQLAPDVFKDVWNDDTKQFDREGVALIQGAKSKKARNMYLILVFQATTKGDDDNPPQEYCIVKDYYNAPSIKRAGKIAIEPEKARKFGYKVKEITRGNYKSDFNIVLPNPYHDFIQPQFLKFDEKNVFIGMTEIGAALYEAALKNKWVYVQYEDLLTGYVSHDEDGFSFNHNKYPGNFIMYPDERLWKEARNEHFSQFEDDNDVKLPAGWYTKGVTPQQMKEYFHSDLVNLNAKGQKDGLEWFSDNIGQDGNELEWLDVLAWLMKE